MTGYRESSFDPYAGERPTGPPSWPFDGLQWTGVGLLLVGVAMDIVYLGSAFGWWPRLVGSPVFGITPLMFGLVLINSRRQPAVDPAPELAGDRRRWLAIVVAVCAVILGIATIFAMKGY